MEKKDLKEIAELVGAVVDSRFEQFKTELTAEFRHHKAELTTGLTDELRHHKAELTAEFRHQLGLHREDIQHKLDLVVEGQQMLGERMDRLEVDLKEEIGKVDQRVTCVAADLAEHRRDTEAHGKRWRVSEE